MFFTISMVANRTLKSSKALTKFCFTHQELSSAIVLLQEQHINLAHQPLKGLRPRTEVYSKEDDMKGPPPPSPPPAQSAVGVINLKSFFFVETRAAAGCHS